METYVCKGCGETYEVNRDPEWREPIHGRCADCWDEFQRNDLEDRFLEAMEA